MSNHEWPEGRSDPLDARWYQDVQAGHAGWVASGTAEDVTAEYAHLGRAQATGSRHDRTGIVITVVVALVVMLCGGTVVLLRGARGSGSTASAPPAATTAAPAGTDRPGVASPAVPSDADPSVVVAGQCVVNDGSADQAKPRVVACGPGTYLVTERFDSTDDVHKCRAVTGFTHVYYYQTTPRNLDFVLCLKKR